MINNHEAKHQWLDRYLVKSGVWAERPGAPFAGMAYKVTDRTNREFAWDGTAAQWLSSQEYTSTIPLAALAATGSLQFNVPRSNDLYIDRLDLTISQVNAGSGVNFWNWATGTGLGISGGTVDTKLQGAGALTAYAYTSFTGNPVTLTANTIGRIVFNFTLNGAPGNATIWATLTYRKVGA
jgi:hypothetical protein